MANAIMINGLSGATDKSNEYVVKLSYGELSSSPTVTDGKLELNFPNCTYWDRTMGGYPNYDATEVHLKLSDNTTYLNGPIVQYLSSSGYTNKLIKLYIDFSIANVTNFEKWVSLSGNALLHCIGIYGQPLDFSSATNSTIEIIQQNGASYFLLSEKFHINVVANSIKQNFKLSGIQAGGIILEVESAISLANGLDGSVSKTLTLSNGDKTQLSTIMGNVVDGTFVYSASGTTTLQDFITNTKGWTLG